MRTLLLTLAIVTLGVSMAIAQELPETLLRHDNFLVFEGKTGASIMIEVQSIPKAIYRYGDDVTVEVIDPTSERSLRELLALGETASIEYEVAMDGTHAVRIAAGWNLVRARITGAPWALVAWKNVPVNISGKMDPLYFKVLDGIEEFSLALSASVTGEGAELTILDPSGVTVFSDAADFDTLRTIELEVPEGADDGIWELRITDPEVEGLYLDDVQFYLAGRIPPFLSPNPEDVEVFAQGERYKPDIIDQTVEIAGRLRLDAGATDTVTWQMDALPEGKTYALQITGNDVDYPRELMACINGAEPFAVPMTGNANSETFKLIIPREMLRIGENAMTLTQDPGGGSNVVVVEDAAILIGERIREYKGY
ncbi:MAG: hypothetical protein GF393_09700 [Armatimonadia bacterium]|nr:hypothetical protein [Armatimonadia bacterium]